MSGRFLLEVVSGKQIPIHQPLQVGRGKDCALQLADRLISRLHATIWEAEGGLFVRDEGSSNGTFVNGVQISRPVRLLGGDRILVGNTTLTVIDTLAVPQSATPAAAGPVPQAGPQPPRQSPSRLRTPALAVVLGVLGLLACAGIALAGLGAFRILNRVSGDGTPIAGVTVTADGEGPGSQGATAFDFTFAPQQTLSANPDGVFTQDEHGVGLRLPAEAVADGQPAELTASELGEDLARMLSERYEVQSLAYQVKAGGAQDGTGRPELRFPASSPQARLGLIVDHRYAALLAVEPQDGSLTVHPFLGTDGGVTHWAPQGIDLQANQYVVLTPKAGADLGSPRLAQMAPVQGASLVECGDWWHNVCRRNPAGTVYLFHNREGAAAEPLVNTIAAVERIMSTYAGLGFTAAKLTPSNPLYIVIGETGPQYSSKTGNLYIPWVTVENISSADELGALAHELAHWTQDEHYVMTLDALSNPNSWWLEMAAENMVMLFDPSRLGGNLTFYGKVSDAGGRFSFQLAPFLWDSGEEARYIHAQNVKLGMCDDAGVCPFNQAGFVQAVNQGTFPYQNEGAKAQYYRNLPNVARYLLGFPPLGGNAAINPPAATQTGNGFGEYLTVRRRSQDTTFDHLSYPPQTAIGTTEVQINAQLARGGLYPLRVSNSGQAAGVDTPWESGHPIFLEIEPGAPFVYSLDRGEPVQESGSRKLFIAPVHDHLGYSMARLVAMAPEAETAFRARVGFVDLSGDWILPETTAASLTSNCESVQEGGDELTEDFFLQILAAYGTFEPDPADPRGLRLVWRQNQPLPEDSGGAQLEGSVEVGLQDITLTYRITLPEQASGFVPGDILARLDPQPQAPLISWAWALPLGALGLAMLRRPSRSSLMLLAVGVILLVGLSGCALAVFGTIDGTYTFKGLEYLSEDFAAERPTTDIWRLSEGQGTITMDLTFLGVDEDDNEVRERCLITMGIEGAGTILEDGVITPSSLEQ